jgi:hypothetical protein
MLVRSTLSVAVVFLAGSVFAGEPLKSGSQVGERIAGRFGPAWLNGEPNRGNDCPV